MNKNIIIIILLLVAVALGGLYLSSNKPKETMFKTTPEVVVQDTSDSVGEGESGKYVEYVDSSTLETENSKTVLFFYANWCSTCIPTDKELKSDESKLPDGVSVVRVNYNDPDTDSNEKALATKYGITYQHTFVQIDEKGNEIVKWNGGSVDKLISNIK